jgi:NTP pyrophosphatase (non-canonical NTP hydrolase)
MNSDEFLQELRKFVAERDWGQFHSPENLSKSISIEAAELLELFQWGSEVNKDDVADELADVLTYCILLADKYGFAVMDLVESKLAKTKLKYPVESAKGKSTKYDRL